MPLLAAVEVESLLAPLQKMHGEKVLVALMYQLVLIIVMVVICLFPWLSTVTPRFFGVRS